MLARGDAQTMGLLHRNPQAHLARPPFGLRKHHVESHHDSGTNVKNVYIFYYLCPRQGIAVNWQNYWGTLLPQLR